ncbi:MAG TPA: transcription elongation factor GreB [Cellvibrionaceae bacterium]|nr:transcription elongation factor GreB [Cellvibrionaceae bacterium]HMW70668.1 transcription elongation factor GreB [Cellvibrionaceae bacterium]HNG61032.1 transcription elongation factor GreB [Cellvibrionaceae bacterium]
MSRYRPPAPKSAPYITREGWQTLQAELQFLWHEERPKVTQVVHEAAKNGDRSENGDYIYGKRRLREIDRRIGYLSRRLDVLKIVDSTPDDLSKIYFGAYVTLEKDDGSTITYRIVGPDEFDLKAHKISLDAPLAKALLGKTLDDEIRLTLADKVDIYYVVDVRYGPLSD